MLITNSLRLLEVVEEGAVDLALLQYLKEPFWFHQWVQRTLDTKFNSCAYVHYRLHPCIYPGKITHPFSQRTCSIRTVSSKER